MDAGAHSGAKQRLFIGLELSAGLVGAIERWQRAADLERGGMRPVSAGNLHLTLSFLGERGGGETEAARKALRGLPPHAVAASLAGLAFRPRRKPRLIAIEVESAAAVRLARALGELLEHEGIETGAAGGLWPHVTVARRRGGRRAARGWRAPEPEPAHGHAVRVALYRSELRPEGSRYTALETIDLPHPGAEAPPARQE